MMTEKISPAVNFIFRRMMTPVRLKVTGVILPVAAFTAAFNDPIPALPVPQYQAINTVQALTPQRYAALSALRWFTAPEQLSAPEDGEPVDAVLLQAPPSTLPFVISGLLSNSQPSLSMAVLQAGSQQVIVTKGNTLPSTDAVVVRIFPDRVVIRHQGRYESLFIK
ncbi:type II secretion system protein N [Erwinia sp. Eh17-17]|uniref:type II secretion system protein N n=1 Tax=Erwinia sp. Eh17-17 TaxID=3080330 RepID=UPI00320AEE71